MYDDEIRRRWNEKAQIKETYKFPRVFYKQKEKIPNFI